MPQHQISAALRLIAAMILETLLSDGLDIMNYRGQGYDNFAIMKRQHSDILLRIWNSISEVQFIACSNYSLNLVGSHAAEEGANSMIFFGTLGCLHTLFSAATHHWDVRTKTTEISMKRLVETIWSARGEVIKMVKYHFLKNMDTL